MTWWSLVLASGAGSSRQPIAPSAPGMRHFPSYSFGRGSFAFGGASLPSHSFGRGSIAFGGAFRLWRGLPVVCR